MPNNNDRQPCVFPGCRGTMRFYDKGLPERLGRDTPTALHHDGELVMLPPRLPGGWVCDQDPRHTQRDAEED